MSDGATRKDECKRLLTQTLKALKEEHDVEEQVQELQKRIRKLRRKGRVLSDDAVEKKKSALQALESYAKVACRELCEEIYNVFPREVRDMIYGHLHTEMSVLVDGEPNNWGSTSSYFTSSNEPAWRHTSLWEPKPPLIDHWWSSECTGEHFRREMSEHYYRSAKFHFGYDLSLLPRFRSTDQWGTGLLPGAIVMNISVKIMCCDYLFDGLEPMKEVSNGGWGDPEFVARKEPWALLSQVDHLFGFAAGTKINIKLAIGKSKKGTPIEGQEWMFNTVVPFILPTLRRLASSGLTVKIILRAPERNSNDVMTDLVLHSNRFSDSYMSSCFEKFKKKILEEQEAKEDAAKRNEDFANAEGEDNDESSEASEEEDEEEDEG